jgi:hypothetical protein
MDFSLAFFHEKGIRSFTHFIQSTSAATFLSSFSAFIKMDSRSSVSHPSISPTFGLGTVSEEFSSDYMLSYNIFFLFE